MNILRIKDEEEGSGDKSNNPNQGLLKTAQDITRWRERFYLMSETIELTNDERNEIWPLVDNFFVRCGGNGEYNPTHRNACHYLNCRFSRKQGKRQGNGTRQRQMRQVSEPCGIRLKMTWHYQEPPDEKGQGGVISRWTYQRVPKCAPTHGADCSIDALDAHKLNSMLRQTAGEAAMSGLSASEVIRIMRSKNLLAAGGKTLSVTTVHNNARIYKRTKVDKKVNGVGGRRRAKQPDATPNDVEAAEAAAAAAAAAAAEAEAAMAEVSHGGGELMSVNTNTDLAADVTAEFGQTLTTPFDMNVGETAPNIIHNIQEQQLPPTRTQTQTQT